MSLKTKNHEVKKCLKIVYAGQGCIDETTVSCYPNRATCFNANYYADGFCCKSCEAAKTEGKVECKNYSSNCQVLSDQGYCAYINYKDLCPLACNMC